MKIEDFDYYLPKDLIAQFPAKNREDARLLIINRKTRKISHSGFKNFKDWLCPEDILVLNDAKVKPARLIGNIGSVCVDVLLVERKKKNFYFVKAKPMKKLKPGVKITFASGSISALVREFESIEYKSMALLEFQIQEDVEDKLNQIGIMPLPPYIKRQARKDDNFRYQTVYARASGAIACPTAGLHFTLPILKDIENKDTKITFVNLNVGLGTFLPVKEIDPRKHKMHKEHFNLQKQAALSIENARKHKGRICAVGTTVCRVLEACAQINAGQFRLVPQQGETDLFIYSPYQFKAVDMLLTNFHFPRTTLLMLVYAFAGRELALKAYQEAVKKKYRFYSYGDCMLII
ncbi:MAG: tRNA preQ1(34) S-adenosylmethionine ribosyltransferase-isomerase QueA [Candidatus Omnitrophota bacterium]|nr:MAG: tRNA preQ1(34) S-adenosylmethionine ribosyltransferase-isomerase QueA [Candidatus Omnitrophota bacterium]